MDGRKREALLRSREDALQIVNNFDVFDVLYSRDVVLHAEYREVLSRGYSDQQGGILIDLVLKRNTNKAFEDLLDVLKTDYPWLHSHIKKLEETAVSVQESDNQETLVLGNFPKLPPYYIERTSKLDEVRSELSNLQMNETLVLHGMLLIGKSCLAVAALQDMELLKTAFNGKVFWINLAEVHDEENDKDKILLELHRLVLSTGAKFDNELVTDNGNDDLKILNLQNALKQIFVSPNYKRSLLVLDKLRCPKVHNYFNVGCKILTTTCDINFVPRHNGLKIIKVNDGFAEKETRQLFQKCLNAEPEQLPVEIKSIHSLCKGHPMLISLIASYIEDSRELAIDDESVWLHVIRQLQSHAQFTCDLDIEEKLSRALHLCIEKLPSELKINYVDLAIFAEDVNISSKVLEILWDKDCYAVRKIMVQLEKRSLVMSFYNKDLKIYIYAIHNLLLVKLREMLQEEKKIALHKKLIKTCEDVIRHWDIEHVEVDDYILQYFGYHLKNANMLEEFNVYFDLKFIDAKIKVVGCADLLRDFQIYRTYITKNDPSLEKKLEEYEKFVNEYGSILHKYKYMDIVQCALQQSLESYIHQTAIDTTRQNPDKLYFYLQLSQDRHYFTHLLELDYDVTAACFTNSTDQVLIGTTTGSIIMWEQHYKREMCRFCGHNATIKGLLLDPSKNSFLSVSEDGTVRLWSLRGLTPRNSLGAGDFDNENIPSPYLRQNRYYGFTQNDGCVDRSKLFSAKENDDRLVSAAFSNKFSETSKLATGSVRGNVTIWNADLMEELYVIASSGSPAYCLTFSCDDALVVFTRNQNIVMYDVSRGMYLAQLCNQSPVNHLLIVPKAEDEPYRLVAVNEKQIAIHDWKQDSMLHVIPSRNSKVICAEDYSFTCAAVMKDGRYIVAGSSDSYLRTWDIYSDSRESVIEKFNDGKVVCLDTFLKNNNDSQVHILLVGSANKTVKQWYVHSDVQDIIPVKNLPVFATYWKESSITPLVAVVNTDKKIQILNGYKLIAETEVIPCSVKTLCFSLDGNDVIYGLDNGDVFQFSYKTRQSIQLLALKGAIAYLKYHEGDILVAASNIGHLTVAKKGITSCLRSETVQNQLAPIVLCLYVKILNSFLTVSKNRTISLFDVHGKTLVLIGGKSHLNVISCAVSSNESRFVCVLNGGVFELYGLVALRFEIELEQNKRVVVDGELQCCCFSFDDKLLAFGRENGNIVIYDVEKHETLTSLELHHTAIRYLAFSPGPDYILVSLSEQIAWWNVAQVLLKSAPCKVINGRPKLDNLTVACQVSQMNLGIWNNKRIRRKDGLLSTIKLHGNFANYVSVSPSFTSFVTVDNNGKIYIIEVLDNV